MAKVSKLYLPNLSFFDTYGNESVDDQKMIAVSEDKGKSFQFINVTNKSKADIIKFFPDINENLKF